MSEEKKLDQDVKQGQEEEEHEKGGDEATKQEDKQEDKQEQSGKKESLTDSVDLQGDDDKANAEGEQQESVSSDDGDGTKATRKTPQVMQSIC